MNLILFSVTTFAVLDYFYRFMRFVSTDLAKIAKFLCFYSKSGLVVFKVHLAKYGINLVFELFFDVRKETHCQSDILFGCINRFVTEICG